MAYDSVDTKIRKTLMQKVPEFIELKILRQKLDADRVEHDRRFQTEHKSELDRLSELEASIEELYTKFVTEIQAQTTQTLGQRKRYLDGLVVVQVRQKPGEYDQKKLLDWAVKYPGVLTAPKKDDRWLKHLQKTHPELLVVDESAAVKLATSRLEDGRPVYEDSPVPIVDYVTTPSAETFQKVMTQLEIEYIVDAREGKKND